MLEPLQPYDKSLIESTLVEIANRRSVSYQVQDLKCVSCGRVKSSNTMPYCACSGKFIGTHSIADFNKQYARSRSLFDCVLIALCCRMLALESIARFHQFQWLHETISWIRHGVSAERYIGKE